MELTTLRVPRALEGLDPLTIDMSMIYLAARRLPETATCNAQRAPELMSFYNQAYLAASRYHSILDYEYKMAINRLSEIESGIILDKLVEILKGKGLYSAKSPTGSEQLRQAVFDADTEWRRVRDIRDNLSSNTDIMAEFKQAFRMAYDGSKKQMGDQQSAYRPNPNLPVQLTDNTRSFVERNPVQYKDSTEVDDFFGDAK